MSIPSPFTPITRKRLLPSFVGLLLTCGLSGPVYSVPIFFDGTGHFYEFIPTATTWADARTAALSMTHLGQPGYLATATSAAENAFLVGLAPTSDGWLGGSDEAEEGTWTWVDGPESGVSFWVGDGSGFSPSGFAAWASFSGFPPEPNQQGDEDFVGLLNSFGFPGWADLPGNEALGYYVEFNAARVTEPSSLALFGIAFLALVGFTRRSVS